MHPIKVLEMIAEDMKNDAKNFDGQPFNGKTVAQYFGNHGAAIAALAEIVKKLYPVCQCKGSFDPDMPPHGDLCLNCGHVHI